MLEHRQLAVTFQMGEGSFGESGFNEVKLSGPLRASATVTEAGGPSFGQLELSVYGMTLSNMNALSTLGQRFAILRKNTVILEAGSVTSGLSVVFSGTIASAWADFSGAPSVVFRVMAYAGGYEARKPVPPTSYTGFADVATIMSGLASQAGLIFTNNGVQKTLISPYFPGTLWDQMSACAKAAQINWGKFNNTIAIWPQEASRNQLVPIVSKDTGLQGYPALTQQGIQGTMLFTPSIQFGSKIQVQSALEGANKEWVITKLSHVLESETPNGQWFTHFGANPPGLAVIQK